MDTSDQKQRVFTSIKPARESMRELEFIQSYPARYSRMIRDQIAFCDTETLQEKVYELTGTLVVFSALRSLVSGLATHVFVEGAHMWDWLLSCSIENEPDSYRAIRRALYSLGAGGRVVAVHFERTGTEQSILAVMATPDIVAEEWVADDRLIWICSDLSSNAPGTFAMSDMRERPPRDDQGQKLQSIMLALGAYISAFPEVVRQGLPVGLQSLARYGGKCAVGKSRVLVTQHANVFAAARADASPHYRSGHFRLLRSDRFRHKQGQMVFVRHTFVRGRAVTIADDV